jgi:hypothetical protein
MLVRNVDDLIKVDPKTQAVRIAHTVGMKKRAEISLRAGERHIYIINPLPEEKPAEEEGAAEKETVEEKEEAEGEVEVVEDTKAAPELEPMSERGKAKEISEEEES